MHIRVMSLSHFDIVIPSCLYYIWCRIWCQLFYSFLKHNRQFKLILPNGNFRFSIIFFRTHFNIPKPQSMILESGFVVSNLPSLRLLTSFPSKLFLTIIKNIFWRRYALSSINFLPSFAACRPLTHYSKHCL